ncbi:hypothetical protein MTO96_018710 [Rhipicephalus appendiculatus]
MACFRVNAASCSSPVAATGSDLGGTPNFNLRRRGPLSGAITSTPLAKAIIIILTAGAAAGPQCSRCGRRSAQRPERFLVVLKEALGPYLLAAACRRLNQDQEH